MRCAVDRFLPFKYTAATLDAGKKFAKSALQRELGLPQVGVSMGGLKVLCLRH